MEQDECPLRRGGGGGAGIRDGGGGGFTLAGLSEEREGLPCVLYGGGGGDSLTFND